MGRSSRSARRTLALFLPFLLILTADLVSAAEQTSPSSSPEFEVLPLTRSRQNHLLVNASINGKAAVLMVDTGSPGSVVTLKRCEYFNLIEAPSNLNWPDKVQVNGEFNKLFLAHDLILGSLDLTDVPMVAAEMAGVRRAARLQHDPQVDGILGLDVLLATKAILDCQQQFLVLRLSPGRATRDPPLNLHGFAHMPITVSDGLNSYVNSTINGVRSQLMIDTGAFATLIHRPFVEQLRIPVRETRYRSQAINVKGDDVDVARIRKMSIGWVNFVDKQVCVTNLKTLMEDQPSSRPVVGLLGPEILRSHHAVIDFGTRVLYMKH